MSPTQLFGLSALVTNPPPGAINVRVGDGVEGPGGRWIPCATKISEGLYYSALFEVGPGRKQVCSGFKFACADQALSHARVLATSQAA